MHMKKAKLKINYSLLDTEMKEKMIWFARFPHPEAIKGVWVEMGDADDEKEDFFYFNDMLRDHLTSSDEPINIRLEKHKEGWSEKFPEL